jgi:hypothetical protein
MKRSSSQDGRFSYLRPRCRTGRLWGTHLDRREHLVAELARGLSAEASRAEAPPDDPLQLLQPRRARPVRHGRRRRWDPHVSRLRFGGKCRSRWDGPHSAQRGGGIRFLWSGGGERIEAECWGADHVLEWGLGTNGSCLHVCIVYNDESRKIFRESFCYLR